MGQIEVFSPAKINLFLAVLGRRADGYHELLSVAAPLDFGDRLSVSLEAESTPEVTLECDDARLPSDARNLSYAAADLFLKRFQIPASIRLKLSKVIPSGAGLGGGSSNAAAALQALASLTGKGELTELEEMAAELGSDCPLFLRRQPVIMRGRGELLEAPSETARRGLSGRSVLLFKPSFSIATSWAYKTLASCRNAYSDRGEAEARVAAWSEGELSVEDLLSNDFEKLAWQKYPALAAMQQALARRGFEARMSGSGSCCFLLPSSEAAGAEAAALIRESWGKPAFVQSAKFL